MVEMTDSEPFRLLLEGVRDYAIYFLEPDGTVASWNAGAEGMTGYPAEEIVGGHFSRFFPPEEVAAGRPAEELRAAAESGRIEREGWRLRKDGSRFWANSVLSALHDKAGGLRGFARVTRDATGQKRAREERERLIEAMEAQRRLFEMVLDHAPAGIAIFDGASLRIKWANATFRQRLDDPWRSADVTGMRLHELLSGVEETGIAELFRQVAGSRKPHFDPEFEVLRPGRDPSYLRFSLLPLIAQSDDPPDLMVLLTDVTDFVEARQRLAAVNRELEQRNREVERANRLKSEFLASMSHELRTPLHTIIGFSDLLAKGDLNPRQKRQTERIQQGARHLLMLIGDILDLSKIEAGRLELRPETFVAHMALTEVLATIVPLGDAKQIRIVDEVAPDLVLRADRVRFKQILYNLLSNAVKFTPKGGGVSVASAAEGDQAEISVTDTGVGIPKEEQKAIFDEFHQVGVTTKGVREGTGLGLAITRRLVKLHGGTIGVESEPGQGSRFTFRLPLRPAEKAGAEASVARDPVAAAGTTGPTGRTVLVADDSPSAREWARDVFEDAGFRFVEAVDGQDALERIRQAKPDFVVLDIQMPRLDGYAVLERLRAEERFVHLPVVALTAFAMQGDREKALAAGFDGYVTKPADAAQLLAEVRRLLAR